MPNGNGSVIVEHGTKHTRTVRFTVHKSSEYDAAQPDSGLVAAAGIRLDLLLQARQQSQDGIVAVPLLDTNGQPQEHAELLLGFNDVASAAAAADEAERVQPDLEEEGSLPLTGPQQFAYRCSVRNLSNAISAKDASSTVIVGLFHRSEDGVRFIGHSEKKAIVNDADLDFVHTFFVTATPTAAQVTLRLLIPPEVEVPMSARGGPHAHKLDHTQCEVIGEVHLDMNQLLGVVINGQNVEVNRHLERDGVVISRDGSNTVVAVQVTDLGTPADLQLSFLATDLPLSRKQKCDPLVALYADDLEGKPQLIGITEHHQDKRDSIGFDRTLTVTRWAKRNRRCVVRVFDASTPEDDSPPASPSSRSRRPVEPATPHFTDEDLLGEYTFALDDLALSSESFLDGDLSTAQGQPIMGSDSRSQVRIQNLSPKLPEVVERLKAQAAASAAAAAKKPRLPAIAIAALEAQQSESPEDFVSSSHEDRHKLLLQVAVRYLPASETLRPLVALYKKTANSYELVDVTAPSTDGHFDHAFMLDRPQSQQKYRAACHLADPAVDLATLQSALDSLQHVGLVEFEINELLAGQSPATGFVSIISATPFELPLCDTTLTPLLYSDSYHAEERAPAPSMVLRAADFGVCQDVQLKIGAKHLPKLESRSKVDPYVVVHVEDPITRQFTLCGHTETLRNTVNPDFIQEIVVRHFSLCTDQRVRLAVYDFENGAQQAQDADCLAQGSFSMAELLRSSSSHFDVRLTRSSTAKSGGQEPTALVSVQNLLQLLNPDLKMDSKSPRIASPRTQRTLLSARAAPAQTSARSVNTQIKSSRGPASPTTPSSPKPPAASSPKGSAPSSSRK